MQNKFLKLTLVSAICVSSNLVLAASKIGIVDTQQVMQNKEITALYQADINKVQQAQENIVKAAMSDVEKASKALEAKAKVANLSTLEKEQDALKDAQNKYKLAAESAKEKIDRAANNAMASFGKDVQEASQKVLQQKDFDFIIDKNACLAFKKELDVTKEVVDSVKSIQATKPAAKGK
jgi:Skp family chaperone for outer membrane proteins